MVWLSHVTLRSSLFEGLASHDSAEGDPEVHVEDGVNDRVEGRVDVAEPRNYVDDLETERERLCAFPTMSLNSREVHLTSRWGWFSPRGSHG